ncbi:hypothetical protein [Bacillus cereus group sp. BfR-BA-01330]|uniref:hypothetical protein n=1 Tax=Bacillus cereus group sp. BfR-BA-01330 TaxID=2920306 RepID=UPI001F5AEF6B
MLKKIIESILEDFKNDINVLIENVPHFSSHYYTFNSERIKSWNDTKRCMYKGCKSKTITGSHTIQKSGPLKVIADNNFVYHPNSYKDEMKMEKKHIETASTFPGFCEKHEKIFDTFERKNM